MTHHTRFSTKQYYRDLKQVYTRLARVDSHHKFVSAFLHNHTIPWGLQINVYSYVPKLPIQESAAHLEKEFSCKIKWASWGFLATLKKYHRNCPHHLRLQVTNLETTIVARLGKTRANTILNDVKSTYTKLNQQLRECGINK